MPKVYNNKKNLDYISALSNIDLTDLNVVFSISYLTFENFGLIGIQ
jgi:hypothetical protein